MGARPRVELHISLEGRRHLSSQVYQQVRAAILDGRLRPGQALPSSRELSRRLAVARNTVSVAYDRLVDEGFLTCRAGAGTYVSANLHPDGQIPANGGGSPLRPRPVWHRIPDPPDMSTVHAEFDFRTGLVDAQQVPYATWRGLLASSLRPTAVNTGAHIDAAGHAGLRAAIARHVGVSRSVRAATEDVFVTSGSQQAIDLIARVLVEPGDVVAVEDPGYTPVQRAFTALGAEVVGVPVDAEGLIVEAIPAAARLVYVSPSHQFPLGMSMSLPRRLALLAWADRVDGAILEDDYDSEFRYAGRPLEPLQSLDHSGRVLYVGSFSKVLLPTLRLGFLVAPSPLHVALAKAKHVTDWHTSVPIQAAAAQFIDRGLLARHIRRMRAIYEQRHRLLASELERADLAEHLDPIPSAAGLHLTATLRDSEGCVDVAVVDRASTAGVAVQALSSFAITLPPRAGLLLGYGAIGTDRIQEGLRRLRSCLEARATRHRAGTPTST